MIRSGQSLLANALCNLMLGRGEQKQLLRTYARLMGDADWRRGQNPSEESKLLAMFADHPQAPFSIHRFVECGADSCGKYPGEWFGPSATARCIQYVSTEKALGQAYQGRQETVERL